MGVDSGSYLFINRDGVNTNRKAVRMITSELHRYPDLLGQWNVCDARGVNNAARGGLGVFGKGRIIRPPRAPLPTKDHRCYGISLKMDERDLSQDPALPTDTSLEYYDATHGGVRQCHRW